MTVRPEHPSWEEVLAAVEDDARRTEQLLRSPADGAPEGSDGAGVPGNWLIPGLDWNNLPPLAEMPPVPEELRDRILEVRNQVMALQDEIAAELAELKARHLPNGGVKTNAMAVAFASLPTVTAPRPPVAVSRFVDRLA